MFALVTVVQTCALSIYLPLARVTIRTTADDLPVIGAEAGMIPGDRAVVRTERVEQIALVGIPDLDHAVVTGGQHQRGITTEHGGAHRCRVAGPRQHAMENGRATCRERDGQYR